MSITDINRLIDSMENQWMQSSSLMNAGNYRDAAQSYQRTIKLLHDIEKITSENPDSNIPMLELKINLSYAYHDLGACYLEVNDVALNSAIHSFLSALEYNVELAESKQNCLFCMNRVRSFLKVKVHSVNLGDINTEWALLHNRGIQYLTDVAAHGAEPRNWARAIDSLNKALQISPDKAVTHHLLGLAYEGAKYDENAIHEWLKVRELDNKFDFETLTRIETI